MFGSRVGIAANALNLKLCTSNSETGEGNRSAERVVAAACKKNGVSLTELRSGSRRGRLPAVRAEIVRGLVENYGVAIAEAARQVGISTSGASKILTRALSM